MDSRHVYSPSSYLHVTVKELGWLGKNISKDNLPFVLKVIKGVAREQSSFDLSLDGVGVFPSVIYGKVGKGAEEIRRMNTKLLQRLGERAIQSTYDGENMIPHVSIAHFSEQDVEPLLGKARELHTLSIGKMNVQEIQVKRSYPHRLFAKPHGARSVAVNEPLAAFRLGARSVQRGRR